jgi:hypothetical protein
MDRRAAAHPEDFPSRRARVQPLDVLVIAPMTNLQKSVTGLAGEVGFRIQGLLFQRTIASSAAFPANGRHMGDDMYARTSWGEMALVVGPLVICVVPCAFGCRA